MNVKTNLEKKYAFWYRISEEAMLYSKQQLNQSEYLDTVKKISDFETIEDFWAIFQHLKRPNELKHGVELQLFKDPVKPMWEDINNKNGGKFSIKVKKEFTGLVWEELILLVIGGTLSQKLKDDLNGIILSVRKDFNIIQVWFSNFKNNEVLWELEQKLREVLQIPENVELDVKPFNKSHQTTSTTSNNNNTFNNNAQNKTMNNNQFNNRKK